MLERCEKRPYRVRWNGVSDAELMLLQVSLQTKKVAPVGLQRIGGQPAFNPQLAEIPFKQEGPAMVPLVQPWRVG